MILEIQVQDKVLVAESIGEAVSLIERLIKEFLEDDARAVLQINITKLDSRAPPALGINVSDTFAVGDMLR